LCLLQNATAPVAKCNSPLLQKCDPLNLGILNLGIEQEELVSSLPALSSDIDEVLQAVEAYNEASTRTGWPKAQTISRQGAQQSEQGSKTQAAWKAGE